MSMPTLLFQFSLRLLAIALALTVFNASSVTSAHAEPLSKKFDLDFFRDLPSRNLHGLATRSDGRLVAGPVLTELKGAVPDRSALVFHAPFRNPMVDRHRPRRRHH
jgi:hypothetical protein